MKRRDFLKRGSAAFLGLSLGITSWAVENKPILLRFGICTDAHYADAPHKGNRYYRESSGKMVSFSQLHQ
jgi:alkaline phosphatase